MLPLLLGLSMLVLNMAPSAAWAQATDDSEPGVSVESAPRWGASPAGAWTPYSVTVRNDSSQNLDGEVVLVPNQPPEEGAPAGRFGSNPPVVALGGRDRLGPVDYSRFKGSLKPGPPVWPTHRAPINVSGGGGSKTLTLMVLEAPFGYSAQIRDASGLTVAVEPPTPATLALRALWTVAVLSRQDPNVVLKPWAQSEFVQQVGVTHLGEGDDLPDDVVHLSGLQAIVLGDFDTASFLTASQIRALRDFVGLGGVLVLGGGTAASRNLASLPDELVPLRPKGTASASLAPLAPAVRTFQPASSGAPTPLAAALTPFTPLAGQMVGEDSEWQQAAKGAANAATAVVATGELRHGRTVVQAEGAPPLLVRSAYGSGHIVQMTYDPFSAPFTDDEALAGLGFEASLKYALDLPGVGQRASGGPPAIADSLWSPVLQRPDARQWRDLPSWPAWSSPVLGLYLAGAGPIAYLAGRRRSSIRRRRRLRWAASPVAALALAAVIGAAFPAVPADGISLRRRLDNVVRVHRLGAGGTALVDTFHGLAAAPDAPLALDLPKGTAGSTLIALPDLPHSIFDRASTRVVAFGQPMAEKFLFRTVEVGAPSGPSGAVLARPGGLSLLVMGPAKGGEIQPAQTLHVEAGRRGVEGHLRLTGSGRTKDARLSGRLTNRGTVAVREVRTYVEYVQSGLGVRAVLAEVIQPGQTVDIDVPFTDYQPGAPTHNHLDRLMFAAAGFHRAGTHQLAVVAMAQPAAEPAADRPKDTFGGVTDLLVHMARVESATEPAPPSPADTSGLITVTIEQPQP